MTTETAQPVADERRVGARRRPGDRLLPSLVLTIFSASIAAIAWLRIPPIARDTLWAEDGRNFLQDAIDRGPIASLAVPYAGYLHTIPRMLASVVVSAVPVSGWALAMTAGSCLVTGALAATILVATRDVVPWMPARVAIAALPALAPLAPREVLGNAANLHSLVLFALFWIALARPRTRRAAAGLTVVAAIGALTEVQSLFLLPLLLIPTRHRRSLPPRIALLAGSAAQLIVTLAFPRGTSPQPQDSPLSIAYGYLINAATPLAVPGPSIGSVVAASGPLVGILVVSVSGMSLAIVVRRGGRPERVAAVSLACGSVLIYAGSVVANPHPFTDYAALPAGRLSGVWLVRYGVVPSMMLAAILVLALGVHMGRADRRRGEAAVAMGVTVLLVGVLILDFAPTTTRRSSGPEWRPQLAAASQTCATLPAGARVAVRETIGWQVSVPCAWLDPTTEAAPGSLRERLLRY